MRDGHEVAATLQRETASLGAAALLSRLWTRFDGRIALASSLGVEDQVLTAMLVEAVGTPRVFTLDTGRLPQATYDVLEATRQRYGIDIQVAFPDHGAVEALVNEHGPNCFYDSIALRKRCCATRKIEPLRRQLEGLDGWVVGLRAEQAVTRSGVERVAWDESFGLLKIAPLADWSTEKVWAYAREHDVPTNALHERGYPSIGCEPCTRAVQPGEDLRAGRWWWETPEHKECGLHRRPDGSLGPKEN